jgi:hypothetical protein
MLLTVSRANEDIRYSATQMLYFWTYVQHNVSETTEYPLTQEVRVSL